MTWVNTARVCAFALLFIGCGKPTQPSAQQSAQASAPPTPPAATPQAVPAPLPKPQFFGGIVTALDSGHITVSRTSSGKSAERRTFLIDSKTKMNRSVKVRARVTVRYRHMPEGDVALEIRTQTLLRPRVL
jgi:hypothetical protein